MAEEPKQPEQEQPKLTVENMEAIFDILLRHSGGVEIPQEVLDNYPKGTKTQASYDQVNKVWHIFIPKKRRRKIITPDKRLLIPN